MRSNRPAGLSESELSRWQQHCQTRLNDPDYLYNLENLVEQNANQALHIADRGYVIENGEITLSGPADELLENSDIQKAYLGI